MAYAVPSFRNWQYLSMRVAAKMAYTSMRIILVYECNANVVYFDGVQLFTASGQRISKTVNGTTYNYHYLGDQLVEMAWGANRMHFTYDAVGPLSVNFNGTEYFYLKNAQGDVTGLVDSTGTKVVAYTCGPWGEAWGVSGTLASTLGAMNPLRYRGYVYDTETGLYYLNSRYYNPAWGRFINADSLIDGSSATSQNMFAYCNNNPVNMADPTGHLPFFLVTGLIGAVAGAIIGGVRAAKSGNSVWKGALKGAAIGGAIGLGAGMAAGAALAGSVTASTSSVYIGANALAATIESIGVVGGAKMVADNISQSVSRDTQVFWSGGNVVKNAAKQIANSVGGKTLEMTRVGVYLEKTNAPYSAWQAASANFANVAVNASSSIYSIQNAAGIRLQSIWATVEYPVLQGKEIIYGIVQQGGVIKFMP